MRDLLARITTITRRTKGRFYLTLSIRTLILLGGLYAAQSAVGTASVLTTAGPYAGLLLATFAWAITPASWGILAVNTAILLLFHRAGLHPYGPLGFETLNEATAAIYPYVIIVPGLSLLLFLHARARRHHCGKAAP